MEEIIKRIEERIKNLEERVDTIEAETVEMTCSGRSDGSWR